MRCPNCDEPVKVCKCTTLFGEPAYAMFNIPFTQYLLPDGRTRPITWECTSHEQEVKARALLDAKARFEAEMLQTGQISLTCEITGNDGEDHTLAHEICTNDKSVVDAVARLVETAHDALIEGTL